MDISARACNACAERDRFDDAPHRHLVRIAGGPEVPLDFCPVHQEFFEIYLAAYATAVGELTTAAAEIERPDPQTVIVPAQAMIPLEAPATPPAAAHPRTSAPSIRKHPSEFICLECPEPLALTRASIWDHARNKHDKHPSEVKWGGTGKPPKKHTAGEWRDDVLQVICPMEHRADAPSPYWVSIRSRNNHAEHHGLMGPEVAWKPPPGLDLPYVCDAHALCVKHSPYGFPTEASLQAHKNKCLSWEAAPQKPVLLAAG